MSYDIYRWILNFEKMKKCVINSFGSGDMTLTREPFTSLTRCKSAKISISLLTFRTYRVYKKIRVSWTEERTNNPKTCLSLNYTASVIFFYWTQNVSRSQFTARWQ